MIHVKPSCVTPRAASLSPWQAAATLALGAALFALEALAPAAALYAALALFLFGIPHGAVERHLTRNGLERRLPSPGYTALYLCAALLFLWGWRAAPMPMLALFLLMSALHFGASEPRLAFAGLWVVFGSLALWTAPTLGIFSSLAATDLTALAPVARIAGLLAGLALAVQAVLRRDVAYGALLLGMFGLLGPVSAVALYYFAVHSLREWRDVHALQGGVRSMLALYAPFSLPVFIGGAAIVIAVQRGALDLSLAAGFGMAIAIPHMAPFERWLFAPGKTATP